MLLFIISLTTDEMLNKVRGRDHHLGHTNPKPQSQTASLCHSLLNISTLSLQTSYQLDEEEGERRFLPADICVGDPDHSVGNQVDRVVRCSSVVHSSQFPGENLHSIFA